jgi:hypothetical protein
MTTMKGLHLLTVGDFVFVFHHLKAEERRALLVGQPLLSGWVPSLDGVFVDLSRLPQGIDGEDANPDNGAAPVVADPTPAGGTILQRRDRVVEASIRTLRGGVSVGYDQALGREDAADAALWKDADAVLFPEGLGFLKSSLPEQVGETIRLLQRAQEDRVSWLAARFNLHGQSLTDTLTAIQHNNDALNAALIAPTPTTEATISVIALRRRAQTLLSDILPVINRAYPAKDPQAASARDALLSPLQKRIAFRVAKQANEKKQAADKKAAAAAADAAAADAAAADSTTSPNLEQP